MGVGLKSPMHQQVCVAGATVLGAAVVALGTAGTGAPYGAAAGFMLGQILCPTKPVDQFFRRNMSIEDQINDFQANGNAADAITKIAGMPTVPSRDVATVLYHFTLNSAKSNPDAFAPPADANTSSALPGDAQVGMAALSNTTVQILDNMQTA